MPNTSILGTLTLLFDDGSGPQEIASIRSCRVVIQTDMKPAMNPVQSSQWDYAIPRMLSWSAGSDVLFLVDKETEEREFYIRIIEESTLNRTLLNVIFESPTGAEYSGEAYIESFELGGAFEDGYSCNINIAGVGPIVRNEEEGEGE